MSLIVEARHRLGQFSLDAAFTSAGGVTALFGRSGSGKTSIVRIVAGLTRPDAGRVVLDDTVLVDTARGIFVPRHKRRFGYVFQEARLFPHLSVRRNLVYGRWFAPKSGHAESFGRIVDLLGIGDLLERRPGGLSGGEKQRVAIGRALLSAPRMLLMDEPLAALDDPRKAEILPYLERLRDEMRIPIIYVSHSVAEVARIADKVIVLANGKIEAMGAAAEVLSEPALSVSFGKHDAGSVLSGTVSALDRRHGLATIQLAGAELHLPNVSIAIGLKVRVHIPARDVMLATVRPEGLSALNILEGRMGAIVAAGDGMVSIRIDCGGNPVLARITELSRERLDLQPGKMVFAIIKTVALEAQ
ncbi:molybdenum ABC transporter ATP-binding protein [Rhizobiaceae bacterium n13]|uniref:Molybdenum ABC transporter ATP-binding protein n=1 Tax=Ferirhizobium litorale TaxID=2927786 RepID=A0AAE3QFN1_9HYPH|nr:molybdenum ABC transporter ATP-binding protein [Fererhizobium litorale]MDI7862250.1 molybdenum ABC transporter ATP-binding protein [Fererhizobium litorale]MDI7922476.1 molybdenum ABC transporter ATP-binding protein [Fererhizobium litorale]